jgi:hypothetical protein
MQEIIVYSSVGVAVFSWLKNSSSKSQSLNVIKIVIAESYRIKDLIICKIRVDR